MTKSEFNSLCAMYYINLAIALENELIQSALFRDASSDEIEEILENEF
jgi:hypothetical protein